MHRLTETDCLSTTLPVNAGPLHAPPPLPAPPYISVVRKRRRQGWQEEEEKEEEGMQFIDK
jgi:hypothetical protein